MRPLILAALLLPLAASAQITPTLLYELESQNTDLTRTFGATLATLGDLDGDGAADLAVADPEEDAGGGFRVGRVYLYSGADGTFLRSRSGPAEGQEPDSEYFGAALAGLGDVTGDGVPDLAVGAPGYRGSTTLCGAVFIVSGATGAQVRTLFPPEPNGCSTSGNVGDFVLSVGDLDGDGTPDVGASELGRGQFLLHVFSGANGALVRELPASYSPIGVSDLTGDGLPEIAASAGGGYAVYDPTSGEEIYTATLPTGPVGFYALAAAGDLSGDGRTEVVAGAPFANPTGPGTWAGAAYVFSGADGALVRELEAPAGQERFGGCAAGVGDVDRDGSPDALVCAEERAFVFSGATGDVLAVIEGRMQVVDRARAVAVLRAGTAEAGAVVALGVSSTGGSQPDRARVYGFPGPVSTAPSPESSALSLTVSPNPSAGASSVAVSLASPAAVRVAVVDALGRTVAVLHEGPLAAGATRLSVPAGLAAGVYAARASSPAGDAATRWVVAR